MAPLNHPYIILIPMGDHTSCYGHVKQGQGKSARREPLFCHRVPLPLTRGTLPAVLHALARALEASDNPVA